MSKKKDKTPILLKIARGIYPWAERIVPFLAYRYFVQLFFTPFRYTVPDKEKEIAESAELFSFQIEGKKIQGYKWGQGPIVVLVHGWAGRATQFRKFIEYFSTHGFQVVGFDGPAHGKSEGKKTHLLEFENTLIKLFEILPKEPAAVITHSFGGAAVLYSITKGLPVKMLINIASPTIGDEIINTYLRAINGSEKSGNYFKKYMVRTFGKTFDEFSSLHFIRHLPKPIELLLVYDEDDKEVDMRHADELIKIYPSARILRTRGLGHTRILKEDAVIETCFRFIAS
jgi:predicted alpha/beta hydrolase family esterase